MVMEMVIEMVMVRNTPAFETIIEQCVITTKNKNSVNPAFREAKCCVEVDDGATLFNKRFKLITELQLIISK